MIPRSNKITGGQPKSPFAITAQAACIYNTKGKCAGIITPDRLQILPQAFSAARQAGPSSSI
eukprot:1160417-Pelagomonas_calceolata.AAC.2